MNIGKLTKQELVDLAERVFAAEAEEVGDRLYEEFSRQFSHPGAAKLFFYRENYNARTTDLSKYEPTIEEAVEIALAHKPIQL